MTSTLTDLDDGRHDFDPLFGAWQVRHHRLRARLAGCADWDDFDGTSHFQPILGGLANIDDNVLQLPAGSYRAATLRAFEPGSGLWRIWWLDGRTPAAPLDPPMQGRFDREGRGEFFADDRFDGRLIRVRFLWLDTRTPAPRWEQAFSADGGATWETNWQMSFSRPPR